MDFQRIGHVAESDAWPRTILTVEEPCNAYESFSSFLWWFFWSFWTNVLYSVESLFFRWVFCLCRCDFFTMRQQKAGPLSNNCYETGQYQEAAAWVDRHDRRGVLWHHAGRSLWQPHCADSGESSFCQTTQRWTIIEISVKMSQFIFSCFLYLNISYFKCPLEFITWSFKLLFCFSPCFVYDLLLFKGFDLFKQLLFLNVSSTCCIYYLLLLNTVYIFEIKSPSSTSHP